MHEATSKEECGTTWDVPGRLRRQLKADGLCPLPVGNSAPEASCQPAKRSGGVARSMGPWFQMVPLSHLESPCDRVRIPEQPHLPCGGSEGS